MALDSETRNCSESSLSHGVGSCFYQNWDQNPQIPVFMSDKIGSGQDLQEQDYSRKVHITAEWGRGCLRGVFSPSAVLPNCVTTVAGDEIQTSVLKA